MFNITESENVGMRARERERDVTFFQVQATVSIAADLLITSGYFILLKKIDGQIL